MDNENKTDPGIPKRPKGNPPFPGRLGDSVMLEWLTSVTQKPSRRYCTVRVRLLAAPDTPLPRSLPLTQNRAAGTRQAAGFPLPADDHSRSRGQHPGPPLSLALPDPGLLGAAPGGPGRTRKVGVCRPVPCLSHQPCKPLANPQLSSGNGNALFFQARSYPDYGFCFLFDSRLHPLHCRQGW